MSCFSQGSAATLFRLGWQVYKFLMSNFLGILYTENYYNRFIFRQVIQITKGEGAFFEAVYIYTLWKIKCHK